MSTVATTNTEPETKIAETAPAPAPDTDEEPQNTLTQKFTDKEWAALKEFAYVPLWTPKYSRVLTTACSLSLSSPTSLTKRMMVRKVHGSRPS